MKKLFLDLDGVLADFDRLAFAILGEPARQFEDREGSGKFWTEIRKYRFFYHDLDLMPGARELFDAVKHLGPTILTGCNEEKAGVGAYAQKAEWVERNFPGTSIIICRSSDKSHYMEPGDVIIDDYIKYKAAWEEKGGIFILYQDNQQALDELWKVWFPQWIGPDYDSPNGCVSDESCF
jgi:hypothetical protein